ncbi:MAG TPA: protein-glutamate O-methyltransferase [Chitinispirillaceae bacterium]|nr:protein-glutamate O-methyltransferase [Chitinispirillaceae bacterium]
MKRNTFKKFCSIIYQRSGITLGDKKEALVSARVGKRTRQLGLDSVDEYLQYVNNDTSGDELIHLLDAISTNVTCFFREIEHFNLISQCFLDLYKQGKRTFRFWSAGCSSGEEPYSIAMTLLDALANKPVPDIKILATDLSTKVLSIASNGIYDIKKVEDLTSYQLTNYFEKHDSGYRIHDSVRSLITFCRLNLSNIPFPMSGPMDMILCRNVMIYFDQPFRHQLINEYYRLLKAGGYLIVGHSESLSGVTKGFQTVAPSIYMKI